MILSLVALFFVCVCVCVGACVSVGVLAKFSQPLYPGSALLPDAKKAFVHLFHFSGAVIDS